MTALSLAAIGVSAATAADSGPRTERVSLYPSGEAREYAHDPSISRHGGVVAYQAPAKEQPPPPPDPDPYNPSGKWEVLAYNRDSGKTESISMGPEENGSSYAPSISRDGRFVAFESTSSNLVPGDEDGTSPDVFVRDRRTGGIEEIPAALEPSISATGRYVAFTSSGEIHVHDRQTGKTELVGTGLLPSISPEGRYVAFQTDDWEGGRSSVVVRDRATGVSETVSVSTKGYPANHFSGYASISAGGRFVAFESVGSNLVAGDKSHTDDVFVRDRKNGTTRCVSVDAQGRPGNFDSLVPSISASGRYVAFVSYASNLIPHDANGFVDVFVRDRKTDRTRRVSISTARAPGNNGSGVVAKARGRDNFESAISGDGHFVAFPSYATNLAPPDPPDTPEPVGVFVRGPLSP